MNRIATRLREDFTSILFALIAFLIHTVVNALGMYDYFRDEFYYIACSDHLAWGYVDHPPLSIVLLWLNRNILGDSLIALRFLPAVASGVLVYLTGLLVRELGGGKKAQFIACFSAIVAPIYLILFDFYSMNAFEPLFWMGAALVLIRIFKAGNQKLWLLFGLLAGLGLQNKHSMAFFGIAVILGLLLSHHRKQFTTKWIWLGGITAGLVFLPNLLWQMTHGWPTLEFMQNAQRWKNYPMSFLEFFSVQILFQHPLVFPVWAAGLIALFVHKDLKTYRPFGIAYVVLFVLFVVQRGKPYYLSPVYPLLFAAGALVFEEYVLRRGRTWLLTSYATLLIIAGMATLPVFLPVIPVDTYVRVASTLGLSDVKTERHGETKLPQVIADRFGWRELTQDVTRVYKSLTSEEQVKAAIYTQNYGEAGALDFFGRKYGLPKAICGHNTYWLWGTRGYSGEVMIIVGGRASDHAKSFESVEPVAVHKNEYAMPCEADLTIYVCRKPKAPFADIWPMTKHYD